MPESAADCNAFTEHKFDGMALALRYEDGRLKSAVTRGDGQRGDEVTELVCFVDTESNHHIILTSCPVEDLLETSARDCFRIVEKSGL